MFVDVEFQVGLPSGIIVPVDAVLDTGLKKTVFIDHGNGYFEPRKVETGARLGDRVFVTSGLVPGDRIVISGNFLIDSESRMKAASEPQPRPKPQNASAHQDPVCGMDIEPSKSVGKSESRGKAYFFCSRLCKEKFDKNPQQYVGKTAASTNVL
jgi:YHS domain-containing protein